MKFFLIIFMLQIVLLGCQPRKAVTAPIFKTYLIYKSGSTFREWRYYYSSQFSEQLQLKDSSGRDLFVYNEQTEPDSVWKYSDMENKRLVNPFPGNVSVTIGDRDALTVNGRCQKDFDLYIEDSAFSAAWFWYRYDSTGREVIIYKNPDIKSYPYNSSSATDSILVKTDSLCSKEDLEREARDLNQMLIRNIKVEITPNPFVETFTMSVRSKLANTYFMPGDVFHLKFVDEGGKILMEQDMKFNTDYDISLPELAPGKKAYYSISQNELVLTGTVMKMLR